MWLVETESRSSSRNVHRVRGNVVEISSGRDHSDHYDRKVGQSNRQVPTEVSRSSGHQAHKNRKKTVRLA